MLSRAYTCPRRSWHPVVLLLFLISIPLPATYGQEEQRREKSDLPPSETLHDDGIPLQLGGESKQQDSMNSDESLFSNEAVDKLIQNLLDDETAAERFNTESERLKSASREDLEKSAAENNGLANVLLARLCMDEGKNDAARKYFRDAIASYDSNDDRYAAYQCHLAIRESMPSVYEELWSEGVGQIDTNGIDQESKQILMSLTAIDQPRFARAHVWLADTLLTSGDNFENAERQISFALYLEPDNRDAKVLLAERILIPQKRFDAALEIYENLFQEYVAFYVKIAELSVAKGDPDYATPFLRQAIERYGDLLQQEPAQTNYLRRRANAMAMLNEHDNALRSLVEAKNEIDSAIKRKQLDRAISRIHLAHAMKFAEQARTDRGAQREFLNHVIKAYESDNENDSAKTSLTRFGFSQYADAPRAMEAYDVRDDPENGNDESLTVAGTFVVSVEAKEAYLDTLKEVQKRLRHAGKDDDDKGKSDK